MIADLTMLHKLLADAGIEPRSTLYANETGDFEDRIRRLVARCVVLYQQGETKDMRNDELELALAKANKRIAELEEQISQADTVPQDVDPDPPQTDPDTDIGPPQDEPE